MDASRLRGARQSEIRQERRARGSLVSIYFSIWQSPSRASVHLRTSSPLPFKKSLQRYKLLNRCFALRSSPLCAAALIFVTATFVNSAAVAASTMRWDSRVERSCASGRCSAEEQHSAHDRLGIGHILVVARAQGRPATAHGRYSFIVSDFHRLLLAGLPAHFESDHPSHAVGLADVRNTRQAQPATLSSSPNHARRGAFSHL
jgi:hypothetical protein